MIHVPPWPILDYNAAPGEHAFSREGLLKHFIRGVVSAPASGPLSQLFVVSDGIH
jgi:hypothetical protein